jgi:hypothetical protein
MNVKREPCCVKTGTELNEWKLVGANGIMWVRLVQDRAGAYGIGFYENELIYFLGSVPGIGCQVSSACSGLIRRVSAFESLVLLKCLAGRELDRQPDVESNAVAWKRWLKLMVAS